MEPVGPTESAEAAQDQASKVDTPPQAEAKPETTPESEQPETNEVHSEAKPTQASESGSEAEPTTEVTPPEASEPAETETSPKPNSESDSENSSINNEAGASAEATTVESATPAAAEESAASDAKPAASDKPKVKKPKKSKRKSLGERARQNHQQALENRLSTANSIMSKIVIFMVLLVGTSYFFGEDLSRYGFLALARSGDEKWFYWSVDKLAEQHAVAPDLYIRALKTEDPGRRFRYFVPLQLQASEKELPVILELLDAADKRDRRAGLYATFVLADRKWLKTDNVFAKLAQIIKSDPDYLCRVYAAMTFNHVETFPESAVPALIAGTEDKATSVRRYTLSALGNKPRPELTKRFQRALMDPENEVRLEAVEALGRIEGFDSDGALVDYFENGTPVDRLLLVRGIAETPRPATTRLLIQASEDADREVATQAYKAMVGHRSKVVFSAFVRGLTSPVNEIRFACIKAIKQRNIVAAVPDLIDVLALNRGRAETREVDETLTHLVEIAKIEPPSLQNKNTREVIDLWLKWYETHKSTFEEDG